MPVVNRPQTLLNLDVHNVKRIRAVNIKPDGNVIIIGGRNAQGKSSVLDSILYAMKGKAIPGKPLRNGEERGNVMLETQDLVISRTFTESGNALKVTLKDMDLAQLRTPQNVLLRLSV